MGSVSSISSRCTSAPFGSGLMRDQRHPENLLAPARGFRGVFGDLDAAAFPAAARVDLRFHNDAAADVLRSRLGFGDGERHLPARHGDFVFGQNRLGLILVDFHLGMRAAMLLTLNAG